MTKSPEFSVGLPVAVRIETVQRLARWTRHHFDVWRAYTQPEDRDDINNFEDEFPAYAAIDEHGHRTLALVYLNALFENEAKTINIPRLVQHLIINYPDSLVLRDAKAEIEAAHTLVSKVARIRGNAIAHRTIKKRHDQIYEAAQLTVDQLDELIALAEKTGDLLATVVGQPAWPEMLHPATDLRAIIRRLNS